MDKNISDDISAAGILVIDDTSFSREVVMDMLHNNGFSNVEVAVDGREGLEKTKSTDPDLVILDLLMPDMDGFEYCKTIRSDPRFKDLPILVQSSLTSNKDIAKAFAAGATDYVAKPISKEEIASRVKVHLQNRFMVRDMKKYQVRIDEELQKARSAQLSMLPSITEIKEIAVQYNIEVASHFETSSELGGDFWGIKGISYKEVGVFMTDFSGHGVDAAMNTFRLQALLEGQVNNLYPDIYLSDLNRQLCSLLDVGQFATMFYGVIDISENKLRYAVAGIPNPIVMQSGKLSLLDGSGVPLGIKSDIRYEYKEMEFNPGDMLMIYSDALVETQNKHGNFMTEEEILVLLKERDSADAEEKLNHLIEKFDVHSGGMVADDLTIGILQRK